MNNEFTSLINSLPDSLQSIESFEVQLFSAVIEDGTLYAHEVQAKYAALKKAFDSVVKSAAFKEALSSELDDKRTDFGAYQVSETYRKYYDYSTCNDSEYSMLLQKEKRTKDSIKKREQFLKNLPTDGVVIEETGEVVLPPETTSKKIIKIEFNTCK